jgi:hypothetical protein
MSCVVDSTELDDESLRKLVVTSLAAVIAFLLAAGLAVAVSRADRGSGGSDDGGAVGSASDVLIGTGTGPLGGTDVATYVAGRKRALADARGRWAAIVSLRDYATGADVDKAFGAYGPSALLVAAPGGQPQVVTGELAAWAAKAKADAEEERTQLQSMAASTDDKPFKDQFNADIDRLTKLLASLDAAKPVVFGFVVTASAGELRDLAGRPDVRLVDVFARHEPDSLTRLAGLRPEETVRAANPPTRPTP